jgi:outer membrane protein OmpA-like peptidoglycan-associated protein
MVAATNSGSADPADDGGGFASDRPPDRAQNSSRLEAQMKRQIGTTGNHPDTPARLSTAGLVAGWMVALALAAAGPVQAQAVDGIVVDLSVIGDGGQGNAPGSLAGPSGKLQVPPRASVHSRLYVQPKRVVGTPAMTEPSESMAESKPAPKAAAAQPAPKAQPKPAVKTVAAPPPPKPVAKPAPSTASKSMDSKMPPPPPAAMASKAPPMPPSASPAPPTAPAASETAAVPAAIAIKAGRAMQIVFDEAETKLPESASAQLNTFASAIRDNKDFRVQLMAYAAAKDLSAPKARRISLSRALEVRSFLIDKGVRSTQIDVRALGNKTGETPSNRVDVNLAPR